ncbi:MAG: response regulator [Phormidesmis sp.]
MLPEQQQRIMGYFIEEAKDHLNTIEQGLLSLEATIKDSEKANELFRAAHSVKGGAAMLGLESIQTIAHRMEDYFKILKESPVQVDSTLETLFLKISDGLKDLLEQLEGPFGLTQEKAQEIMAGVDPVFGQLERHLNLLVAEAGDIEDAIAPSHITDEALQTSFKRNVSALLRQLLATFKQADDAESRKSLQAICEQLVAVGEQFELLEWCDLTETARMASANLNNEYRILAPVLIKEIKKSQDLVLSGRASEVAVSEAMQALLPDDILSTVGNAESDGTELFYSATDGSEDDDLNELFGFNEEIADLSSLSDLDLDGQAGDRTENAAISQEENLSEAIVKGTAVEETTNRLSVDIDFNEIPSELSTLNRSIDRNEQVDESLDALLATVNVTGPDVGSEELTNLADLFDGDLEELDNTLGGHPFVSAEMRANPEKIDLEEDHFTNLLSDDNFADLIEPQNNSGLAEAGDEVETDLFGGTLTGEGFIDSAAGDIGLDWETKSYEATSSNNDKGSLTTSDLTEKNQADLLLSSLDSDIADFDEDLWNETVEDTAENNLFGSELFDTDVSGSPFEESENQKAVGEPDLLAEEGIAQAEGLDFESLEAEDLESDLWEALPLQAGMAEEDNIASAESEAESAVVEQDIKFLKEEPEETEEKQEKKLFADSNKRAAASAENAKSLRRNGGVPTVSLFYEEPVSPSEQEIAFPTLTGNKLKEAEQDIDSFFLDTDNTEAKQTPKGQDTSWEALTIEAPDSEPESAAGESAAGLDLLATSESNIDLEADLEANREGEEVSREIEEGRSNNLDEGEDTDLSINLFEENLFEEDEFLGGSLVAETGLDEGEADEELASEELEGLLGLATDSPDVAVIPEALESEPDDLWDDLPEISDTAEIEDLFETAASSSELVEDLSTSDPLDDPEIDEDDTFSSYDLPTLDGSLDDETDRTISTLERKGNEDTLATNDFLEFDATQPDVDGLEADLPEAETTELQDLDLQASEEVLEKAKEEALEEESEIGSFDDLESLLSEDSTETASLHNSEEATTDEVLTSTEVKVEAGVEGKSAVTAEKPAETAVEKTAEEEDFDDLERLLEEGDDGDSLEVASSRRSASRAIRRGGAIREQNMRVPVKHLDNLSNLVGELVVSRNTLERDQERLRQFLDNLLFQVQQLNDVGQRMRDLYERSLLESSLVSNRRAYAAGNSHSTAAAGHATGATFDALEMDRFTGFHTLSQEMIELIVRVRESSSDIGYTVESSDQVTRQFRQITTQLQEGLNTARMVAFSQAADRLPRAVRDIALKCGKEARLVVEGKDTLIDKMILEHLYDPLTHLVNNAITHGIERPEARQAAGKPAEGVITVQAFYQGNQTVIYVADDGGGINPAFVQQKAVEKKLVSQAEADQLSDIETYELLFHPGFSTRDQADDFAGRGVGMDVVRTSLAEIRGVITVDSEQGKGTSFTIRLPLTLSISKALSCVSNQARIAFPMDGVEDMLDVPRDRIIQNEEGQDCVTWRDRTLPFQAVTDLLKFNRTLGRGRVYGGSQDDDILSIIVLRSANTFVAIQVDQVIGEEEIVIKQLEGPVPKPLGIAGATILGDGRVMPIADVLELIDIATGRVRREPSSLLWAEAAEVVEEAPVKSDPTVLIVDDSITVRELLSMSFNKVGYRVEQARDGQEAWDKLRSGLPCDLVFCDIEMPRMDGLELLSRMQKDSHLKQIPIAMLTSRGADRHRQMAVDLGASGYFTKPYLEEALLDAAQRMLNGETLEKGRGG